MDSMDSKTETEFDEIWDFVEEKLKTPVPTYFKNILKVCGYNNGISIASIAEDDLQYFVKEVRNGSVAKYFEGKIDQKKVFEGSTKTAEDFEFSRGHQTFLMSIVHFLKKYLHENGPDAFTLRSESELASKRKTVKSSTKKPLQRISITPRKELNFSNDTGSHPDTAIKNSEAFLSDDLKKQQGILISKAIMSLINHVPEMYVKNIEMISERIASDLINVGMISELTVQQKSLQLPAEKPLDLPVDLRVQGSIKYTAEVSCPFCTKNTRVFHVPNGKGMYRWNSSNFDRHLKNVHLNKTEIPSVKPATITSKADETYESGVAPFNIVEMMSMSDEKTAASTSKVDEMIKIPFEKSVSTTLKHNKTPEAELPPIQKKVVDDEITIIEGPVVSYPVCESNVGASMKSNEENECHKSNASDGNQKQDQKNDTICPKPGDFVICTLPIRSSVKWPENTPVVQNFVGRVCQLKGVEKNKVETVAYCEDLEEIKLQFLKRSPYFKYIFISPENVNINYVPKNKIVKILQTPSKNRRGQFVFKDKSILDYNF